MLSLLDADALEVLAREGLTEEAIPTEVFRPIVAWCLDYWFSSGRSKAPTLAAIRSEPHWANALDDHEVPLGDADPEDSIEWAIEDLRSSYAHLESQRLLKQMATALAEAEMGDIPVVVDEYADRMVRLSVSMVPRDQLADVRTAAGERLLDYEHRAATQAEFYGMRTGLSLVDDHTFGIHDGELAIFAAGPKVGKSYALALFALAEWRAGRVPALFTLENSVPMTVDRMACLQCGVDSQAWQRGECLPEQVEAVRYWISEMESTSHPLYVFQPDLGKRSFGQMVRQAQIMDVDSMLVDQLTFVELDGDPRQSKTDRIGISLHQLKGMISTGRKKIPCGLAHQINRDGVRYAEKNGFHSMLDLADSSEVERTADWVFSFYRSSEHRALNKALMQTLASRRAEIRWWEMEWRLSTGRIRPLREVPVAA